MANELSYYGFLNQTGLTVIARVYDNTGLQVGPDIPCVEAGSLAIYICDMPTAPLGEYGVRFFENEELLGQNVIYWDGGQESILNIDEKLSLITVLNNETIFGDVVPQFLLEGVIITDQEIEANLEETNREVVGVVIENILTNTITGIVLEDQ